MPSGVPKMGINPSQTYNLAEKYAKNSIFQPKKEREFQASL
jgi:hypothetical protein